MSGIYWLLTLSKFGECLMIIGVVMFIVCLGIAGGCFFEMDECYDEKKEQWKHYCKVCCRNAMFSSILIFVSLFIPTKEEFAMIYGLGSIKDYIETSPEAKKLPDNVIKTLNVWMEDFQINEIKK